MKNQGHNLPDWVGKTLYWCNYMPERDWYLPHWEWYRDSHKKFSKSQFLMMICTISSLVLAMGLGNLPAVQVWTAKRGWFSSRPVQKSALLTLGGTNPDPYPSTRRVHWVWLDPSVPISSSAFWVSHL